MHSLGKHASESELRPNHVYIYKSFQLHHAPHSHTGTMLGPYFGKAVHKENAEGDTHEWLWEVGTEVSHSMMDVIIMPH